MPTQTFLNLPEPKRSAVVRAAMDEFSKRNVEEAKLSNIVRAAGIPRGSIYQYFDSKQDLYVYVFEMAREERQQYTRPAYDHYLISPFLTFFEHFYALDIEYLARHPIHIQLGKVLYSHASGVSLLLIRSIRTRLLDTFLLAIERDQERGLIRADADRQVLADLCVHFVTDIAVFQSLSEPMTPQDMCAHLKGTIDLIRRGIE